MKIKMYINMATINNTNLQNKFNLFLNTARYFES